MVSNRGEKGVFYLSARGLGVGGTPFYEVESSLPILREGLGKTLLLIFLGWSLRTVHSTFRKARAGWTWMKLFLGKALSG